MALAAFEAGVCINNSSVTLVHGMSRPIGAIFHVSHGKSNAMILGECLEFALDGATRQFAELAKACEISDGTDTEKEAALKFLDAVKHVVEECGIPSLKSSGIDTEKFIEAIPKMAEDAMASGSPGNTRKKVTKEDCENIYRKLIG